MASLRTILPSLSFVTLQTRGCIMLLSLLRPRDRFVIKTVRVGQEVGRRLADMGFTEGTDGVVVRRGGFGGPMQIRIRAYDLLIRKDEAASIDVDVLEYGCGERRFRRGRGHMRRCDTSCNGNSGDAD